MLKRFEVKNFKGFKDKFVFDLSQTKDYQFNPQCVNNGIVSTGIIYGPNGCGKSNLGRAIFDIKTHMSDSKIDEYYNLNYLNAESNLELAEFVYIFQFDGVVVEYRYRKKSVNQIEFEQVIVDGKEVISLNRKNSNVAYIELDGAETLNRTINDENISVLKYVKNNSILSNNRENRVLKTLFEFITNMHLVLNGNVSNFDISENVLTHVFSDESKLYDFEEFLLESGVKCHLCIINIDGKKQLAFDFGDRRIQFSKIASTGTLTLYAQYIILFVMKMSLEIINIKRLVGDHADISNNNDIVNNINILNLKHSHDKINSTNLKSFQDFLSLPYFPFIFMDEFDAFYQHSVAKHIVEILRDLNCQAIFTTHNTSIMSNDLLRPDCYFIMSYEDIKPTYSFTDKELRQAHNIEKMYRAGVFDE